MAATWICWSCREPIDVGGVSLDDSDELHCCDDCWDRVQVSQRFWLGLLFRSHSDGGLGLVDLLGNAVEGVKTWPFGPSRN